MLTPALARRSLTWVSREASRASTVSDCVRATERPVKSPGGRAAFWFEEAKRGHQRERLSTTCCLCKQRQQQPSWWNKTVFTQCTSINRKDNLVAKLPTYFRDTIATDWEHYTMHPNAHDF